MKKIFVLCVGMLPMFVDDCFGVAGSLISLNQTKSECIATCANTHCCTNGKTFTKGVCPTGWTYNDASGRCERTAETTYSEILHRYTTVQYSSCEATTSTEEAWQCVNYSSSSIGWTGCCVINATNTACSAISLM
ncbi:MAG: hypothetical protein IJX43_00605 [Alphaproteobacteria bacterium]|nr:hypothetical protein [Alphaproteobacteria bacterium]